MRKVYPIMTLMAFMLFGFMTTTAQTNDLLSQEELESFEEHTITEGVDFTSHTGLMNLIEELNEDRIAQLESLNKTAYGLTVVNGQMNIGANHPDYQLKQVYDRIKANPGTLALLKQFAETKSEIALKNLTAAVLNAEIGLSKSSTKKN